MTTKIPVGVSGGRVRLVSDEHYLPALRSLIAEADRRVLCSMFIVDLWPWHDPSLAVDTVLLQLQAAAWRGCDVRLLIGGSRSNLQLAELADAARARALSLGLPCRWLTKHRARGSHAKLVISDDRILTGSHNWSPGAFTNQTQDSIAVESAALAALATQQFEAQWQRAAGEQHVSP